MRSRVLTHLVAAPPDLIPRILQLRRAGGRRFACEAYIHTWDGTGEQLQPPVLFRNMFMDTDRSHSGPASAERRPSETTSTVNAYQH